MDPKSRKILDSNPYMTELLGYTGEDLRGKELFEIGLLKDERANHGFRGVAEDGLHSL